MKDPRKTAKDLMALALDERGNEKERLNAAFRALKVIDDNGLLDSPLDGIMSMDNEHVKAAGSIFETLSNPEFIRSVKKVAGGIASRRRRSR